MYIMFQKVIFQTKTFLSFKIKHPVIGLYELGIFERNIAKTINIQYMTLLINLKGKIIVIRIYTKNPEEQNASIKKNNFTTRKR